MNKQNTSTNVSNNIGDYHLVNQDHEPFSVYVFDNIPDCIKDKLDQSKNDGIHNTRVENSKKILCQHYINSLNNGYDTYFCPHYDKCLYAHGLKAQIIDDIKLLCINLLIDGIYDVTDISIKDKIYKNLFIFVDNCNKCVELEKIRINNCNIYGNKFLNSLKNPIIRSHPQIKIFNDKIHKHCIGGINCRHGSPFKELKICKEQFFKGSCNKELHDILIEDPELLEFKKTNFVPSGCENGLHIKIESHYDFRKIIDNIEPEDPKRKMLVINMDIPDDDIYDQDFDKIFSDYMAILHDDFFTSSSVND
jgi:hypothetical protein